MNQLNRGSDSGRPIKLMQFGGGNFLRAYIDWMVDVLNEQTAFNGAVLVIKPTKSGDYTSLRESDGLYHVLTNGIKDGKLISETHLIKCVQSVIHPYLDWDRYIESSHNPDIRIIVSNTTEAGIRFNPDDKVTDQPPQEFPAKLCKWLYHRWKHFNGQADKACIFLPCELIENNGEQLKNTILQYANHWSLDEAFKDWLNRYNVFCNTLVDRIVTGYPSDDRIEEVNKKLGIDDPLLVEAEPYHLLVIEGPDHIKEEIPFHHTNLNVVFTNDLKPYRELKVGILNGAHTALVPVGYLAGIETVREAIEDETVGIFINELLFNEIIPTLPFPEDQKIKYANDVIDRFKNPFIKHKLIDISLNAIPKFKTRLLPTLKKYSALNNKAPANITKALAALIVFYRGRRGDQEITIKASQEVIDFFKTLWTNWEADKDTNALCVAVLSKQNFWEQELTELPGLVELLVEEVKRLIAIA